MADSLDILHLCVQDDCLSAAMAAARKKSAPRQQRYGAANIVYECSIPEIRKMAVVKLSD